MKSNYHMQNDILADILSERQNQDAKWGFRVGQPDPTWTTILTEEVGEAAKEVLSRDFDKLRAELVQCGAVVVAWLEDLDAREGSQTGKVL
jgi:NTP pyrophosphatase (non-canonical NTP hydrolase)